MRSRVLALLALAVIVVAVQGCAVGNYFVHRYEDFTEMADFGITVTDTPQLGLYWNSLEALVFGYSDVDGYFVGFGGGQIGITRHYNHCWGLLYGEEQVGWGSALGPVGQVDKLDQAARDSVISKRRSGMVGIMSDILGIDVTGNDFHCGPDYTPACVHFVPHIAYVGLVWNARYMQMLDFMLGWFGIDIAGDDGYDVGEWSFPRRSEPPPTEVKPARLPDADVEPWAAWTGGRAAPLARPVAAVAPVPERVPQPVETIAAAPAVSVLPAVQARKYVVKNGDVGLMQIAREQLGDVHKWRKIAELNSLDSPYIIKIGQELTLPD